MIRCLSIIYYAWLCAASVMMAQQPAASAPTAAKIAASVMTVSEQDNGKTIELTKGATLVVELSSNASTGYSWSVQSHSPLLKLVKSDYQEQKQPAQLAGAPGVQTFQWRVTTSGTATLQLEYRRSWEKSVPAAQVFSITVQVR
jgi:inhibitor of cysteine peptidase